MVQGEKSHFVIKPQHAFGAEGNKEFDIGPNTPVEYEVSLDSFEKVLMQTIVAVLSEYISKYDTNMDQPDNYPTTYDSKTNIVIFYYLSNAFDIVSVRKYLK